MSEPVVVIFADGIIQVLWMISLIALIVSAGFSIYNSIKSNRLLKDSKSTLDDLKGGDKH